MEKLIAIIGTETVKLLAQKHNVTEHEIMVAAVNGNPKILSEIKRCITFAVEVVKE